MSETLFLVSTYDPLDDFGAIVDGEWRGMYWRPRQVVVPRGVRAMIRSLEQEGYDRQVSILVEKVPQ